MDGEQVTGGTIMLSPTYFCLECPTCGRSLVIRVKHLGRRVQCEHCGGTLVALDPAGTRRAVVNSTTLLERADELLESGVEEDGQHTSNPR